MADKVLLLVGTKKGAFIFESDAARTNWAMRGPFCDMWPIHHVIADPTSGTIYAGGGNAWFGPAVWKSNTFGATWSLSNAGLSYAEGETPVAAVWSLAPAHGELYAGVEPAGLFKSTDSGASFTPVSSLREHPSRASWVPGAGGMILHSIVPKPSDPKALWVGISTAGVFYTPDGGATWTPRNRGTRADFMPEDQRYPEHGQCVHCIVRAPGEADWLYQQNHCGMYRSRDGGISWQSIEAGLPSTFGFPAVVHPRDPQTLYLVPLNGDIQGRFVPDGKAAVWRTRDGGDTWTALRQGLPQENAYFGVLRQALAVDQLDRAGVYFGTGSGRLYASADEGDNWACIAEHLPAVSSVETLTVTT